MTKLLEKPPLPQRYKFYKKETLSSSKNGHENKLYNKSTIHYNVFIM